MINVSCEEPATNHYEGSAVPASAALREREREAFYILCPASSLMDVPGYVNPDKLMNVPIGFVCR